VKPEKFKPPQSRRKERESQGVFKRKNKDGIESEKWYVDYRDPNGKRIIKAVGPKKDAEAYLGKQLAAIREGRFFDVKKETILKQWLKIPLLQVPEILGSNGKKKWSGRADLNGRPPAPKAGALTRLRYAPMSVLSVPFVMIVRFVRSFHPFQQENFNR
jgi:hypothetical protein